MKTHNRNNGGRFSGGMREITVGAKKARWYDPLTKTKPAVKTVKLKDGRTEITCKPDMIEFWKAKYPNAKII